jgi:hypothetical protein
MNGVQLNLDREKDRLFTKIYKDSYPPIILTQTDINSVFLHKLRCTLSLLDYLQLAHNISMRSLSTIAN